MADTRTTLLDATLRVLRDRGITGISGRVIATEAGVNQALIFYHFGTVDALVDHACRNASAALVSSYRDRFAQVSSLPELLALGRTLHQKELETGNVAVLAQVLAGAPKDPVVAAAGRYAMDLWVTEIQHTMGRLLASSPVREAIDVAGLSRAVAAAFVGIELYDGVDPAGAESALTAIDQLSILIEVVEDLGPVARRALRNRMKKAAAVRDPPRGRRTPKEMP